MANIFIAFSPVDESDILNVLFGIFGGTGLD